MIRPKTTFAPLQPVVTIWKWVNFLSTWARCPQKKELKRNAITNNTPKCKLRAHKFHMNSCIPSSTIMGSASLFFSRNIPNMYWWKAGDYLRLSVNARQYKHFFFRIGLMTPKQSHCASNIHFETNLSNEHDHFWYFGPMLDLLLLVMPFKSSHYHNNIKRIKGDIMTTTVSQLVLKHFRMANRQTALIFVFCLHAGLSLKLV